MIKRTAEISTSGIVIVSLMLHGYKAVYDRLLLSNSMDFFLLVLRESRYNFCWIFRDIWTKLVSLCDIICYPLLPFQSSRLVMDDLERRYVLRMHAFSRDWFVNAVYGIRSLLRMSAYGLCKLLCAGILRREGGQRGGHTLNCLTAELPSFLPRDAL